jgi:hypothetical protein
MINILRNMLGISSSKISSREGTRLNSGEITQLQPVRPKVLLIVYDPRIPSKKNRRLSEVFSWNDVNRLVDHYIADISEASHGYCNYQIAESLLVDAFPVKEDGFVYKPDEYFLAWRSRQGFHVPDWADYDRILEDFEVVRQVMNGQVDEVWLFAFPYGGFYESRMVGSSAFWCNSPALAGGRTLTKRFIVMGFNYERGVGEMLESFGHRAESIMAHVFRGTRGKSNLWKQFVRYEGSHPGQAEVGNVHYAPNSIRDYDWGNSSYVYSSCDNWYRYPDLSGAPRRVNCSEWGNGDTRLHHLWWLRHFPHVDGSSEGFSHNWWEYVIYPNLVV